MQLVTESVASERHVISAPGRSYHLRVEANDKSLLLVYIMRVRAGEALPSGLVSILGLGRNTVEKPVLVRPVKLAWWEKLIGRSVEQKAEMVLSDMHQLISNSLQREQRALDLQKMLLGVNVSAEEDDPEPDVH